jgi:hypothetical protein
MVGCTVEHLCAQCTTLVLGKPFGEPLDQGMNSVTGSCSQWPLLCIYLGLWRENCTALMLSGRHPCVLSYYLTGILMYATGIYSQPSVASLSVFLLPCGTSGAYCNILPGSSIDL